MSLSRLVKKYIKPAFKYVGNVVRENPALLGLVPGLGPIAGLLAGDSKAGKEEIAYQKDIALGVKAGPLPQYSPAGVFANYGQNLSPKVRDLLKSLTAGRTDGVGSQPPPPIGVETTSGRRNRRERPSSK